jgi:hypothetical protein
MVQAVELDNAGRDNRLFVTCANDTSFVNAIQIDADGAWDRIIESMRHHGSVDQWTPAKAKYAWCHGISRVGPTFDSLHFRVL